MTGLPAALQRSHVRHMTRKNGALEAMFKGRIGFIENELKSRHPWQNRSGDAEKSLGAKVDVRKSGLETIFTMTIGYIKPPRVKYGIHLENARAGAFAIVRPTVRRYGPQILAKVRSTRNLA